MIRIVHFLKVALSTPIAMVLACRPWSLSQEILLGLIVWCWLWCSHSHDVGLFFLCPRVRTEYGTFSMPGESVAKPSMMAGACETDGLKTSWVSLIWGGSIGSFPPALFMTFSVSMWQLRAEYGEFAMWLQVLKCRVWWQVHVKLTKWRRFEYAEYEEDLSDLFDQLFYELFSWHLAAKHRKWRVFHVVGSVARPMMMAVACGSDDVKTS